MIVNSCLGFGFFEFQGRKDSKRERNSFNIGIAERICLEDKWSKVQHEGEEMYKRSVVKAELLEVSPCTFPAYDSSQINCRSFERMKADTKEEKRLEELRKEARLLEIADENNKE